MRTGGVIGIDIGGSAVKGVRLDADGGLRSARVAYTRSGLDELARVIREAGAAVGARKGDRLGVCAPGVLEAGTGVIRYAANLPCLAGVAVGAWTASALEIPARAVVLPDAGAMGLGAWHGAPVRGRLLALAMGTGIGGALVENGRLLTLDGVTIGHIGQMDVSWGEDRAPIGPDGGRGSLEAYAGGAALLARFGEANLADGIASMREDDPCVRALVRAIRVCHAVYKPDAVRLLGGLGAMFAPIVGMIRGLVAVDLTRVARPGWTLETMDDPFLAARGVARAAGEDPSPVC
jgi:glucokinase